MTTTKTIGETIEELAQQHSGNADWQGLYILQEAAKRAAEIRSMEQRHAEADAIFADAFARLKRLKRDVRQNITEATR
tara:strand:+ start:257 stop:490 length:234 start_codon:yes stop_codon:yes gene_type:complete